MNKIVKVVKEHKKVIAIGAVIIATGAVMIAINKLGPSGGPFIVVDDGLPGIGEMQKLIDNNDISEVFVGIKDLKGVNHFFGTDEITKELTKGFKIIHV